MSAATIAGKSGMPLWAEPDIASGRGMSFGKALTIAAVIEIVFISLVFMFPPTGKHIAEKEMVMEVVDVVEEPPPPPEPEKIVEEKPKEVEKILEKVQEAPKPQAQPEQAPIPMEAPKPIENAAAAPGGMSVPTAVGESKPAVGNPADAKPAPPTGPVKGLAPKSKVAIEYPRKARENDVQGLVVAWAHIDEAGKVTDVEIKKTPAGGTVLGNEVKRKLMQWIFNADGRQHIGIYEVNFTISGEEEEIVDVN